MVAIGGRCLFRGAQSMGVSPLSAPSSGISTLISNQDHKARQAIRIKELGTALAVKRREFIGLLGGAAAWPLTASAQRSGGKIVTIGILAIGPWPPIDTFRHALNDLGYIEGKNVRFEYRYAKGHNERLPELANHLVGLNVDVIVTWGTDAVLAAKQATTTIPIVMGTIADPPR